jgi:surface antigen
VGWRYIISREAVSGSIPVLPGLKIRTTKESTSKLKLPKLAESENTLPTTKIAPQSASLTPIGRVVQKTSTKTSTAIRTPRYVVHMALIAFASTIVFTGSSAGPVATSPFATQGGYGSVLDHAAAADIAAKVASQANLVIEPEITNTATTLNAQTNLMTAGEETLAMRQVVDTAGVVSRDITNYKVQPGDTLSTVAAKFNVTTDTIRWANGIDESIKPGQVLAILPVSGIRHKVTSGETPESLASKYDANAEQIIAFNNAEATGLRVGSTIVIPDGSIQDAPKPAATTRLANALTGATTSRPTLTSFAGNGNSYSRGYCTYYVASRRSVPSSWGNASSWYYNAQISGFKVGSAPMPGAIAWGGGGYYGHVAYVESVSGGMVTVSEMNYNGNWNRVTSRTVPASTFRYIY